jgi:hypothetical protein
MEPVNPSEKFAKIADCWKPRIVGGRTGRERERL